jgi:alpha-methylacyl-CoA racemase
VDEDVDELGVQQPLVHMSRTPSLPTAPTELIDSGMKVPELVPGDGNEEVVRRWLGVDDIRTDDGGRIRIVSKSKL